MTSQQSEWLTAVEAARHLRIEPRTLLLWARQGKVKGYVLSGTKRVRCCERLIRFCKPLNPE
jgi:hypothetical protein